MASIASQIKTALIARINTIDGTGSFNYDIGGRCNGRPSKDDEPLPNAGVFRESDVREDDHSTKKTRVITWVVEGFVSASDDRDGDPGEMLLEDFERAVEVPDGLGGLLEKDPVIVQAVTQPPQAGSNTITVAITIETKFPHKYGDPEYVY